jgi:hypothetical protein
MMIGMTHLGKMVELILLMIPHFRIPIVPNYLSAWPNKLVHGLFIY